MKQCGPIEADDDKATRHPGEFAEDTQTFDVAVILPLSQLTRATHLTALDAFLQSAQGTGCRVVALTGHASVWNPGAAVPLVKNLVVDLSPSFGQPPPDPVNGPWPIRLWDPADAGPNPWRNPGGQPYRTQITITAYLRK